jgi:hypothetical protein
MKMLTHVHKDGDHLLVLAHLLRRWSLRGREGFGALSPSHRTCEAGFRRFRGDEMPIFLYANIKILRHYHVVFHELNLC